MHRMSIILMFFARVCKHYQAVMHVEFIVIFAYLFKENKSYSIHPLMLRHCMSLSRLAQYYLKNLLQISNTNIKKGPNTFSHQQNFASSIERYRYNYYQIYLYIYIQIDSVYFFTYVVPWATLHFFFFKEPFDIQNTFFLRKRKGRKSDIN